MCIKREKLFLSFLFFIKEKGDRMKKKLAIFLPILLVIVIIFAVVLSKGSTNTDATTKAGTDETYSTAIVKGDVTGEETTFAIPEFYSCVVYAPKHSEVFFDGEKVEYDERVKCHRIFTEDGGKHTVTVSKYGCNTVTKEVDFDEQRSAEVRVDLTVTDEYIAEVEKVAYDNLLGLIEVCADESGDLSRFNFYSETEKAKIQKTVDKVINDLCVDEGDYTTGKLTVAGLICNGMDERCKTLLSSDDLGGTIVNFTLDYNYTWEFNGENYQDSGVDSNIQNPFIKMDYIDGQWCIRYVYMYMRKSVH